MSIAPVVTTVEVSLAPKRAFELFTGRMGDWWDGKTVGAQPHVAIVVEPRIEGRWYERDADGNETDWGKVLAFDPPGRLLLGWQLDSSFRYNPDFLTEVEITFLPTTSGGTTVRLEHRDLERFGADAERIAAAIGDGWPKRLGEFERFAEGDREAAA